MRYTYKTEDGLKIRVSTLTELGLGENALVEVYLGGGYHTLSEVYPIKQAGGMGYIEFAGCRLFLDRLDKHDKHDKHDNTHFLGLNSLGRKVTGHELVESILKYGVDKVGFICSLPKSTMPSTRYSAFLENTVCKIDESSYNLEGAHKIRLVPALDKLAGDYSPYDYYLHDLAHGIAHGSVIPVDLYDASVDLEVKLRLLQGLDRFSKKRVTEHIHDLVRNPVGFFYGLFPVEFSEMLGTNITNKTSHTRHKSR